MKERKKQAGSEQCQAQVKLCKQTVNIHLWVSRCRMGNVLDLDSHSGHTQHVRVDPNGSHGLLWVVQKY